MTYDPNLILNDDTRLHVLEYLESIGHPAPGLAILTNVQLINLYHDTPSDNSPSATQLATSAAIIALLGVPGLQTGQSAPRAPQERLSHHRTDIVIKVAGLGHNIMLVGPAGCGKTTIGEHVAEALRLPFYITNTVTDTYELKGFVDGYGNYHTTPFREAFERGGVWIADEVDAWDANALLAANSALANGFCNFPNSTAPVIRHVDFRVIATANTFGTGADRVYVGRNELDAASLDRFVFITVDYDNNLERIFSNGNTRWYDHVLKTRETVNEKKIRHVVSSRAIANGSVALRAGIPFDDVNEMYLLKGMSPKDRSKLDD